MKKILIISDTHGDKSFFKEIIEKEKPDIKIHCGDFCVDIDLIKENFDYFVAGNNDNQSERIVDFKIEDFKCRLLHGDQFGYPILGTLKREMRLYEYAKENNVDILFSGHTHIEQIFVKDNILLLNPGSLVYPRNVNHMRSYAVLNIEGNKIKSLDFEDVIRYPI